MRADAMLRKTVAELLEIEPADNLTIKQICERAGVSRPSFYYYYKDIGDLIWHALDAAIRQAVLQPSANLESWKRNYQKVSDFLHKYHSIMLNVHQSKYSNRVLNLIGRAMEQRMFLSIQSLGMSLELDLTEDDTHFLARFYRAVHIAILVDFVETGRLTSAENYIRNVKLLTRDPVTLMVKRMTERPTTS